jgi:exonuclease III
MDIEFGTWNVRTLHKSGALKAFIQQIQQYKLKVIAIQETRWLGNEIWDTETHSFEQRKETRTREAGVAFILDKVMKRNIINFDPINERICILYLKTKFFNLSIINAYAPTEDKEELIEDSFYQEPEKAYDNTPSNDIKMVIRDFYAKIGNEEIYQDTVGRHTLHDNTSDNGQRVIYLQSAKIC